MSKIIDLTNLNEYSLTVGKDVNESLIFNNLSNASINIKINIKEGIFAKISFMNDSHCEHLNIEVNMEKEANAMLYFADFSKSSLNCSAQIDLAFGSSAIWNLASLTSCEDKKVFNISCSHNDKNTVAKIENFGVCQNKSKLTFSGVSCIRKGSAKSKTQQNARIMVIDDECDAIAKPILKIDENDVQANHAAVVGKINDEHLYYLMTRGLTEEMAKQIITYGYLKPILNGFDSEEFKEHIINLIESRV